MKRLFRKLSLWAVVFGLLSTAVATAQDDAVNNMGRLTRKFSDVPEIPISISSQNPEILALARRAFEIHGAFKLAPAGSAKYQLILTPTGSGVNATLAGGPVPFSANATGPTVNRAALRACDAVVKQILNIPGFFDTKVAFVGDSSGNREIYTSDLLFSSVRRLTSDRSNSIYPRWSPDGTRMFYTGYFKSGFPDIFLLNLASSSRATVASFKGTNTGAIWSPNGQRTAMVLSGSGNPEIYVGDANGRNLKQVTKSKSLEASPSFSPDGTRLIFVNDQVGNPQLYEMSAEGGAMKRVSYRISNYCTEPAWNPRKDNLVVFTAAFGRGFQLALLDRATGQSQALTGGGGSGVEPCWLNDGRHVIYSQKQGASSKLRIFDTESGRNYDLHSTRIGNASQPSAVYQGD